MTSHMQPGAANTMGCGACAMEVNVRPIDAVSAGETGQKFDGLGRLMR
jgi:hypothetical protein